MRLVSAALLVCALSAPALSAPIADQWDLRALPPSHANGAAHGLPTVPTTAWAVGRPPSCPPRRWCGCWLAHQFGLSDRALWRARHWARIGAPAAPGCVGCVAVLRRGSTGGHVGIVTGYAGADPIILSGNHNNAVGVAAYPRARVIAYRWVAR